MTRRRPGVAVFDPRRNTSRVHAVPPGAAAECRRACREWAERNPAHYRWLLDGHPTLTDAEHRARFGEPYQRTVAKRGKP